MAARPRSLIPPWWVRRNRRGDVPTIVGEMQHTDAELEEKVDAGALVGDGIPLLAMSCSTAVITSGRHRAQCGAASELTSMEVSAGARVQDNIGKLAAAADFAGSRRSTQAIQVLLYEIAADFGDVGVRQAFRYWARDAAVTNLRAIEAAYWCDAEARGGQEHLFGVRRVE